MTPGLVFTVPGRRPVTDKRTTLHHHPLLIHCSVLKQTVDEIIFSTSLKARNITRNTPKDTAKEITQVSTKVDTKNNAAVGPVNNSPRDIVSRGSFTEVATKTVIISRVFKTQ